MVLLIKLCRRYSSGAENTKCKLWGSSRNNRWFTSECSEKRSTFYHHLNLYRKNKTDEYRSLLINSTTEYKNCIKQAKFKYDNNQTKKMLETRFKNAKLYWKMLKQSAGLQTSNITMDVFANYF